jgi:CRISPR/Cas system-associated exonuclease Cas4 (RecB family)
VPRPAMPDGLYTSVSQMKCWLRCPRQFELKYVRGVPPAFVPVNLAFGSAIHEALAAHYGEMKSTGSPLRRDLVLDVFRAAWEKAQDGDVPLQADEDDDLTQVVDKGVSMLHAFYEHASKAQPFEVEAVEHGFTVPLHDPDTGEELDEQLVGTMDLIVNEGGRRVVVEHKSSSKKYTQDQLRFDLQVSGYKLAAREAGMGEVGLRFQVITKTKIPAVQVSDLERDHHDEEDFVRTAVGVLKAIDAGVSYPIRGWMCRGCPYAHACWGAGS